MRAPQNPRMYILILNDVALGHQVNCAAHASLACYLKFQDYVETTGWLASSFRKVTCLVDHFELADCMAAYEDYVLIKESALDNQLVAVAFRPKSEYPKVFRELKLFGASNNEVES